MNTYQAILIKPDSNLRDAIEVINTGAMQIALVVDEQQHLLGTITDGDIRRAILKGLELTTQVDQVMSKKPIVCREEDSNEKILELALDKQLYHIPIVSPNGKLIGLQRVDDLIKPESKENSVVLMAGGQGIRLRPLTETTPKPLLNVGGRPILETIIKNFKKHGFSKFYLSVNYMQEMIRDHFGDGSSLGVQIEYLEEKQKLGTAGALSKLKGKLNHPFFVMNGDILTNINFNNFINFHINQSSAATVGVRSYDHQIPYGVILEKEGQIQSIQEKPIQTSLVNAGVYVLNPDCLDFLKTDEPIDMPEVFNHLLSKQDKVCCYQIQDYWVDIGRLEELNRANSEFDEVF